MISFAVATIGLLSFSCLAATSTFASASTTLGETLSEREQAQNTGFKFSAAFYTVHSKTFCSQTSVTESKDGKKQLSVEWSKVLSLKEDIRDNDLLPKAELFIQSTIQEEVRLGEKLLVSVELLGEMIPIYKYLINHDADIMDCIAAHITGGIPQAGLPNTMGANERLAALGSHEALKRKIMSIRDGSFGFKRDYAEYDRLLTLHGLTEEDLI